jgi:hypothetical protein
VQRVREWQEAIGQQRESHATSVERLVQRYGRAMINV